MTRGCYPEKAIKEAQETAEKRGLVRHYAHTSGRLCDFSIVGPAGLAEIRIKPMRHIRCTPKWLEREAAEDLAALNMYPSSPQISRELWISSPAYFQRYFRVCDIGLIELAPGGQMLPAGSPVTGQRRSRAGAAAPVPGAPAVPATTGSPELPVPRSPAPVSPVNVFPALAPPAEGTPSKRSVHT